MQSQQLAVWHASTHDTVPREVAPYLAGSATAEWLLLRDWTGATPGSKAHNGQPQTSNAQKLLSSGTSKVGAATGAVQMLTSFWSAAGMPCRVRHVGGSAVKGRRSHHTTGLSVLMQGTQQGQAGSCGPQGKLASMLGHWESLASVMTYYWENTEAPRCMACALLAAMDCV